MLLRLIALVVLAVVLWMILEKALAALVRSLSANPGGQARAAGGGPVVRLVRCDACGVHVPATRALTGSGGHGSYCSAACRRAAEARAS